MIYVLLLEQNKFYVGYSERPIGERFIEHFNRTNGSRWTSLYRPLQVLICKEGGVKEENEMTLRMMDEYGWWNVRGGNWCQVDMHCCPPALLEWQRLKVPEPLKTWDSSGNSSGNNNANPYCNSVHLNRRLEGQRASNATLNHGNNTSSARGCNRCGRNSHTAFQCFAKTDINGYQLMESVLMAENDDSYDFMDTDTAEESVDRNDDDDGCCFRCGRNSHFVRDCFARTDVDGNLLC